MSLHAYFSSKTHIGVVEKQFKNFILLFQNYRRLRKAND
jgi:hypothetical protein